MESKLSVKAFLLAVLLVSPVFAQRLETITFVSGASTSSSVAVWRESVGLRFSYPVAIEMPSAWTAADLLVEVSTDGSNWKLAYDSSGDLVRIRTDANRYVVLDASITWAAPFIRFRSVEQNGTNPVSQAAARTLKLVVR